jgi:hypothetical protein
MPLYRMRFVPKCKKNEKKTMIYYSYPVTSIGSTIPIPPGHAVPVTYDPTLSASPSTPLHLGGPQFGTAGAVVYPTTHPTYVQQPVINYSAVAPTYVGYQQPVKYIVR